MFNKLTTYAAAAVIGVAALLPVYGCGKVVDFSLKKKPPIVQISGLTNVRTTIEDFINAAQTIEFVVGENASTSDLFAAFYVAMRIDQDVQTKYHITQHTVTSRLDKEIKDPSDNYRVYVGQESTNKIVALLRSTLTDPQERILPGSGTGVIEAYEFSNGKKAIVITGTDEFDVEKAGFALSEYDRYISVNRMDIDGKIIHVDGPSLGNIQTTVYKK